jgi:RNA polymerase sigma-70 factor (ECF subfamily)
LEESQRGKKRKAYRLLKPLIIAGASEKSYAEIGRELGLEEGSVKSAVHRLRKDYGKLLKDEVRQTLSEDDDADEELKYLFSVLTR